MNSARPSCPQAEAVSAYAVHALPSAEARTIEDHLSSCAQCRETLEQLQPVVDSLVSWPTDVLRPPANLQLRLSRRLALDSGIEPLSPPPRQWLEPEWKQVAPGISCKLLATDATNHSVGMLVRLAPGGEYPAHIHAGVEELHLLDGELWIDERRLFPGDYNWAKPGTRDKRVWSETGCTCVLTTSTRDRLLTDRGRTAQPPNQAACFVVLPEGSAWLARHPAGFSLKFSSKQAATDYARAIAMQTDAGELTVYDATNQLESYERFERRN
jgi:anti-sigma factor ChrR (cupin superfamily)